MSTFEVIEFANIADEYKNNISCMSWDDGVILQSKTLSGSTDSDVFAETTKYVAIVSSVAIRFKIGAGQTADSSSPYLAAGYWFWAAIPQNEGYFVSAIAA